MSARRLKRLSQQHQSALAEQYSWLESVHEFRVPENICVVSVSVFDHWLTENEAREFLVDVSPQEQNDRDRRHAAFCAALIAQDQVLYFSFRGRERKLPIFHAFNSPMSLERYCTPKGGRTFGHRHFRVALPEMRSAFYEGWDDTNHIYSMGNSAPPLIIDLAGQHGLHVLPHD